ncbi:hypothetical protein ONZ43_g1497 [Nemania bipapillata]|uniref:Uncharacterized protein n=1 Tax=Nemania bipapillata TaxID=110536 RepID=A0ACC2J4E5_9PEZI|nr:hypothetical protein ONZ43_g1497 [Nemania bipapillata]
MSIVISPSGVAKHATRMPNAGLGDETGAKVTTDSGARKVTSAGAISPWKTRVGDSIPLVQESTTSPIRNVRLWQGGGSDWQRSWHWDGIPTAIATYTATVTYTQLPPTASVSQLSSSGPAAPEARAGGAGISAPAVAGIGAGAGIGLLGIGIVVVYFYTKRSHRRKHQLPRGQVSGDDKPTSGTIWLPYPYPASNNESPAELSATSQPKEMGAEPKPQEKDASNRSEIA